MTSASDNNSFANSSVVPVFTLSSTNKILFPLKSKSISSSNLGLSYSLFCMASLKFNFNNWYSQPNRWFIMAAGIIPPLAIATTRSNVSGISIVRTRSNTSSKDFILIIYYLIISYLQFRLNSYIYYLLPTAYQLVIILFSINVPQSYLTTYYRLLTTIYLLRTIRFSALSNKNTPQLPEVLFPENQYGYPAWQP